ncbi:magnesium transporter [Botrimarina hoheduenensis]|uniref:Magnesium transporter MgtE n=1 Tax=Botrimarina hoheduenensis TaxID=2528000 RepID=A0A5C5WB88_9BACT|nr:magnesium transporter [Botrimarina hoheduenensis]TWT47425.1 Magnesium transporter MgtE [Botrimarina hoheduenensis]
MEETQRLADAIHEGNTEQIESVLEGLDSRRIARVVCALADADQTAMLTALTPEDAAELLEDIPDVEVIEAVSQLSPATAAAILHELPSDEQADLVGALDEEDADAILAAMDPAEAERIAQLVAHDPESAGGLMATEVVSLRRTATVGRVLDRFRKDADRLRRLDVQYAYVTEKPRRLVGVLRLRDLLLADATTRLEDLMIANPLSVSVTADLRELSNLFEEYAFLGVPVVDAEGELLGVVSRSAVDDATQDQAESDFRRSLGLVEEEVRSLPTLRRSRLRLAWLTINILLNVVAASVIAGYQDTLAQVIALAVFLPIISDMSGCSGNQAVAVSMRELSLGLIEPFELLRVWLKEASVGLINGVALGGLIGVVGWLYTGNAWLGLVVGGALGINTLVAVLIGGALPLVLKLRGIDPALAAGPILTTVTDMFGFFLVLSLATAVLPRLVG